MTVVAILCGAMLTVAAALTVVRVERGPSILDRTVALDILVSVLIAAIAVYAAVTRRTDVVPVLVSLALVGFIGSVTVARFAHLEPEGEGRVRTREEVAAEKARQVAAEEADEQARRTARRLEAEQGGTQGEVR